MRASNYDKSPRVQVSTVQTSAWEGWRSIGQVLRSSIHALGKNRVVLAVDCYAGVLDDEVLPALASELSPALVVNMADVLKPQAAVDTLVEPYLGGSDPVFGHLTSLSLGDFLDPSSVASAQRGIQAAPGGLVIVYGTGASLVAPDADLLIYADIARWEAQTRFRRSAIGNLGAKNHSPKWSLQYKRAFFVDWRVCDRHKKQCMGHWDFLLDTNCPGAPKLARGAAIREGLRQAAQRPFRVVPFFDPAPWGGQWMKETCGLDRSVENYGWCFDCVLEENSLLLQFGEVVIEIPSLDLVLYQPRELLGEAVHARFGAEFPIRFDFLDTMGGGNLSFQVHPLTEYIQQHFGMHYTQDESYYLLDAGDDACVYLGLKEGVNRDAMADDLRAAQLGDKPFPDAKYVNRWPARKHDHFLIPAGTCHCSGAGAMVLEISATPYIFTFKLWDWGRMGLDGKPRPIHIDHGLANLQWDRTTDWVRRELVNHVQPVAAGVDWCEERTGLHEREFIETRRHWFTGKVTHHTNGGVNVLNLVEGDEVCVESPMGAFHPYVIHYAETFIVPASVGAYTIRPIGRSAGKTCATIKAFVRTLA